MHIIHFMVTFRMDRRQPLAFFVEMIFVHQRIGLCIPPFEEMSQELGDNHLLTWIRRKPQPDLAEKGSCSLP